MKCCVEFPQCDASNSGIRVPIDANVVLTSIMRNMNGFPLPFSIPAQEENRINYVSNRMRLALHSVAAAVSVTKVYPFCSTNERRDSRKFL